MPIGMLQAFIPNTDWHILFNINFRNCCFVKGLITSAFQLFNPISILSAAVSKVKNERWTSGFKSFECSERQQQ